MAMAETTVARIMVKETPWSLRWPPALPLALGRNTGLVNPHRAASPSLLRCNPTFVRQIRTGPLAASQFPDEVLLPEAGSSAGLLVGS